MQGRWEEVTTLTTQVSRIEGHGGLYTTAFAFLFGLGAAYEKVLPLLRVGLPTSVILTWKIPHRYSPECVSAGSVNFIKLTVKINFTVGKLSFLVSTTSTPTHRSPWFSL